MSVLILAACTGRVPQPVAIPTRPVGESWRALVDWCTYIGVCQCGVPCQ